MSKDIYVNVAIKYEKVSNGEDAPTSTLNCWVASVDGKVFMKENSYKTSRHNPRDIILSITENVIKQYPNDNIVFYSDYGSIYESLRSIEQDNQQFSLIRRKNLSNEQLRIDDHCQNRAAQGVNNLKKKRTLAKNKLREKVNNKPKYGYAAINNLSSHAFYVATDASYSDKQYKNLAFASWVSEDGDVFVDTVKTNNNNEAEAYAVKKALKEYAFPGRNLVILTDSRYVVDAVQGFTIPRDGQKELRSLVDTLSAYQAKGFDIRIKKIKGHSGHIMNESAHRSANFARNFHNDYGNLHYQKEINKISKTLRSLKKIP